MFELSNLVLLIVVVVSLFIIVKSADYFVLGAASVAKRFGIQDFIIGLTVIAIGTSAPELVVNVLAAFQDATALSLGNVLGSNIINIMLGLGIASLFAPLAVKHSTVWKEFPFMLLSVIIVLLLGAGSFFSVASEHIISRADGMVLLSFFIIFIVYTFGLHGSSKHESIDSENSLSKSLLFLFGGLVTLLFSGEILVKSAVALAESFGVSQNLIGLTIVAIGTSLPEIVTAISAVRKGMVDMVVGGIVGSNIFNMFLILGATSIVAPLQFTKANFIDTLILIGASLSLFFSMFIGKKHSLERGQGILFIVAYVAYIVFALIRG